MSGRRARRWRAMSHLTDSGAPTSAAELNMGVGRRRASEEEEGGEPREEEEAPEPEPERGGWREGYPGEV
eukprot:scaffold8119_cov102-Isochrysis_galbana.AAC.2